MESMLVVDHLSQGFGRKLVLDDVSFVVPKGKICVFIGANGAGKTTAIKSIVGLWPYKDGKITINGINAKNPQSRMKLGYVPEKENFPKESANYFIKQYTKYYELTKNQIETMMDKMFHLFEIEKLEKTKLTNMSSGQKKKLLIMQALLHNPDLLIMDEPTENMDPDARINFYKIMKLLINEHKTVFISTHQLDEIQKYANYAVIIKQGKIVYVGEIDKEHNLFDLYEKHVSRNIGHDHKKLVKIDKLYDKEMEREDNGLLLKKNKIEELFNEGVLTKDEYKNALKRLEKGN